MCGICGFSNFKNREILKQMSVLLIHRGPDGEGFYEDENTSLGMRRLSIIDLETGNQPIHSEDKNVWIVCNGEIYNYKQLRKELEKKGHIFYTHSDIEPIVHLYEEHNLDLFRHLRGMFSLAIWDKKNQRLILARDRIGIKPLYYIYQENKLFFSSEIKSFLKIPGFKREINQLAIAQYLSFLYIPAPNTVFKNLYKLLPGHALVFEYERVRFKKFWDLEFPNWKIQSLEEIKERINKEMEDSVKLRLQSDVPLGCFLSGGLDSSIIVGLMAKNSSKSVKTFTVGFSQEKGFNELRYAKEVANYFNTEHHECIVEYKLVDLLPKVIWHFDEPFGNSTNVLAYILSQYTRKYVKVALSGTGGDEVFLGYPRYLGVKFSNHYNHLPYFMKKILTKTASVFAESTKSNYYLSRLPHRFRRFVQNAHLSIDQRYLNWLTFLNYREVKSFLREDLGERLHEEDVYNFIPEAFNKFQSRDILDRVYYTDVKSYLPFNQLEYVDKMSMANSLEVRVPFCDHSLMELSSRISPKLKIKGINTKAILKETFKDLIPSSIIKRNKVGFDAPIGQWLKKDLKDFLVNVFLRDRPDSLLNLVEIRKLVERHFRGQEDLSIPIWSFLVLDLWYQLYIVREIKEQPDYNLKEVF